MTICRCFKCCCLFWFNMFYLWQNITKDRAEQKSCVVCFLLKLTLLHVYIPDIVEGTFQNCTFYALEIVDTYDNRFFLPYVREKQKKTEIESCNKQICYLCSQYAYCSSSSQKRLTWIWIFLLLNDATIAITNSYSASRDNCCTVGGDGVVGSARYELALLPPCPTLRVLSYSN